MSPMLGAIKSNKKAKPYIQSTKEVSKWTIGGSGTLRDAIKLPPPLKLSLDLIWFFITRGIAVSITLIATATGAIRDTYTLNPWYLGALLYGTLTIAVLSMTKYVLVALKHYLTRLAFQIKHKRSSEPIVSLDEYSAPSSSINLNLHLLIGGDSGSGKSNLVWHILSALKQNKIPYELDIIDPAGGVELNDLEHSQRTRSYTDRPNEVDQVIIHFRDDMYKRLNFMKQHRIKKFNTDPTTNKTTNSNPLANHVWRYLLIDELLLCQQQLKQGVDSPLGEVLAVGRKAGFIVIACTQLGQKSTLGDLRDLFPQRACFKTRTQDATDATLGSSATKQGAEAHLITRPGIGFVWTDLQPTSTINNLLPSLSRIQSPYKQFTAPLIKNTYQIAAPYKQRNNNQQYKQTLSGSVRGGELPTKETKRKTAVYRLFSEDNVLIYIGKTDSPNRRFKEHQRSQAWFADVHLPSTVIEWFPDNNQALDAETLAIKSERPLFNDRDVDPIS